MIRLPRASFSTAVRIYDNKNKIINNNNKILNSKIIINKIRLYLNELMEKGAAKMCKTRLDRLAKELRFLKMITQNIFFCLYTLLGNIHFFFSLPGSTPGKPSSNASLT